MCWQGLWPTHDHLARLSQGLASTITTCFCFRPLEMYLRVLVPQHMSTHTPGALVETE